MTSQSLEQQSTNVLRVFQAISSSSPGELEPCLPSHTRQCDANFEAKFGILFEFANGAFRR